MWGPPDAGVRYALRVGPLSSSRFCVEPMVTSGRQLRPTTAPAVAHAPSRSRTPSDYGDLFLTYFQISDHNAGMPRRKPGGLRPIEVSILSVGLELALSDEPDFHGFAVAKRIAETEEARRLTATGTLYRALHRMEAAGWLESRWEDPQQAADDGRPPRRLYRVTTAGAAALAGASRGSVAPSPSPGLAT